MEYDQAERFVRKINYGVTIPVKFKTFTGYSAIAADNEDLDATLRNLSNESLPFVPAENPVLFVSIRTWAALSSIAWKEILLHEVGHYHSWWYKTRGLREFHAHVWAIERAESLGMYRVSDRLQCTVRNKFRRFSQRRYATAASLFEKEYDKG